MGTLPGVSARPESLAEKMPNWQPACPCRAPSPRDALCSFPSSSFDARNLRLFAQRPGHRTVTTKSEQGAQVAPNLLQRDFSAERPDTKWVADTTSIWRAVGWLYLAVVLDLFSPMVGGWSLAATVVCDAGGPGARSSPETSWVTPSHGSREDLHE